MRTHGTFCTLVKFTTVDVSLSKDVFDKAVKSALGRVNTHGISNITQHQSKALLNFKRIWVAVAFGPKNFTSGLSGNRCEGLHECALQRLFYGEMTFILVNGETSKRQEKQLFADWRPVNETVPAQNIIYRMTAEKFEYETNSTQMRFVE